MPPSKQEKIFIAGMHADKPREQAPKWVITNISVKVPDLIPFLKQHQNNAGYVNMTVKESAGGKYYVELNTWKPKVDGIQKPEPLIDPKSGLDLSGDNPF